MSLNKLRKNENMESTMCIFFFKSNSYIALNHENSGFKTNPQQEKSGF